MSRFDVFPWRRLKTQQLRTVASALRDMTRRCIDTHTYTQSMETKLLTADTVTREQLLVFVLACLAVVHNDVSCQPQLKEMFPKDDIGCLVEMYEHVVETMSSRTSSGSSRVKARNTPDMVVQTELFYTIKSRVDL